MPFDALDRKVAELKAYDGNIKVYVGYAKQAATNNQRSSWAAAIVYPSNATLDALNQKGVEFKDAVAKTAGTLLNNLTVGVIDGRQNIDSTLLISTAVKEALEVIKTLMALPRYAYLPGREIHVYVDAALTNSLRAAIGKKVCKLITLHQHTPHRDKVGPTGIDPTTGKPWNFVETVGKVQDAVFLAAELELIRYMEDLGHPAPYTELLVDNEHAHISMTYQPIYPPALMIIERMGGDGCSLPPLQVTINPAPGTGNWCNFPVPYEKVTPSLAKLLERYNVLAKPSMLATRVVYALGNNHVFLDDESGKDVVKDATIKDERGYRVAPLNQMRLVRKLAKPSEPAPVAL